VNRCPLSRWTTAVVHHNFISPFLNELSEDILYKSVREYREYLLLFKCLFPSKDSYFIQYTLIVNLSHTL
jgi:hypothetical protein